MPAFIEGDMWAAHAEGTLTHVYVTSNGVIKKDGSLVMGKGAAKDADSRFNLQKKAGERIAAIGTEIAPGVFSYKPFLVTREPKIGLFQTKHHWKNKADLSLIWVNLTHLTLTVILDNERRAAKGEELAKVGMNFPGIGLGGLSVKEVKPLLSILPSNVCIFTEEMVV